MSLAAQLERFKTKTVDRLDTVTRLTVEDVGERVVSELSPVGDPTLWQSAPPADYRPGNFRGNWFLSVDAHTTATHDGVGILKVNDLDAMPARAGGHRMFIQNSLPYAQALEYGHSSQSPAGIIAVIAVELQDIAEAAARRVAQ